MRNFTTFLFITGTNFIKIISFKGIMDELQFVHATSDIHFKLLENVAQTPGYQYLPFLLHQILLELQSFQEH